MSASLQELASAHPNLKRRPAAHPLLSVTVPVLNEAECLIPNIRRLSAFLEQLQEFPFEIVIADNGSTDSTLSLAHNLANELQNLRILHLDQQGRGRALKAAWRSSDADILCYMDADLSTDLSVLPAMVAALFAGRYGVAVASRRLNPSSTQRSLKRELISRVYAGMVRLLFGSRFSDPQCGFKLIRREVFLALLPLIRDDGWFFDTELLVLAERHRHRILDVPAAWIERRETRVKLIPTVLGDLTGLASLRWRLWSNHPIPLASIPG
jgi:glycosyltransferase involved in cell wall biosynthesis